MPARGGHRGQTLKTWFLQQAALQEGRWALWSPVAVGVGAGLYFALPREPVALLGMVVLLAGIAGAMALRRLEWGLVPTLAAAAILLSFTGFGLAKLRTEVVRAPVLPSAGTAHVIDAWVVDVVSPGRSGPRLLLAPVWVSGLSPAETPIRLRVTLRDTHELPEPGAPVRLSAILNPPPPPASPGAYDFARDAFYEGVGAVGFALKPPSRADLSRPPARLAAIMALNAFRWRLAVRIVEVVGPPSGGLAAAMVTGQETFIPKAQVDDLRTAGLSHIISISGLHMAIVGGFVFAAVRLGVAAWPWAALRAPGKKIAALAGLGAVLAYLLISGAPPPAQRAGVTAVIAFGAVLVDRRAISLHTLALAALVVLAIQPEAVTEPGFQMSFAATAALVALAEAWTRPVREINTPLPIRLVQAAGAWITASAGVSLVAGLATAPFAIQHFNRVSVYGLPANLLVAPISSFLMMPALALGAVLAPLGWGGGPLTLAGWAIDLMLEIAGMAAKAPHAILTVPSAPGWVLPTAFIGLLWICLVRGPGRWLGLPFALAVSLAPRGPAPDAWIAADGAAFAVRAGREAVLLRPDVKRFGADFWAQHRGLQVLADGQAARDRVFDCDRWSCVGRPVGPAHDVAVVWSRKPVNPTRLEGLCRARTLVLVRDAAWGRCPDAVLVDRDEVRRGGSGEFYRAGGRWRAVWSQDLRGDRPWTKFSGSGG